MTDREKLEKIRAEIERRIKLHKDSLTNPIHQGFGLQKVINAKISELTYLLSFTDSMQKKPKECMYSKDNYKDKDRKILCDGCKEECKFNKKEEPVSENLVSVAEEFIQEHTKNCSNDFIGWQRNGLPIYASWLTPDQARRAVEMAREEIYEWLRVNLCDYFDAPRKDYDMCINDLKQAMKDGLKN